MPLNPVIDMHTHLFNGYYVPIEEILTHKFGFPRSVAISVGIVLKAAITEKPAPNKNWLNFAQNDDDTDLLARLVFDVLKMKIQNEISNKNKKLIFKKQKSSNVFSALIDITRFHKQKTEKDFGEEKFVDEMAELLQPESSISAEVVRLRRIDKCFDDYMFIPFQSVFKELKGYVTFFFKMLNDDNYLCNELINKNYKNDNLPALTIHLTMDIEPVYREKNNKNSLNTIPPIYPFFNKQISEAAKHIRKSRGRLLGFVAFDPRRGKDGLQKCWDALEVGNIGIKIYPPMNYKPDNFNKFPVFDDLYSTCQEKNVPILTHCTPEGFQAWEGTGLCSDPDCWDQVLRKYPDLHICFGHAGGGRYNLKINNKPVTVNGWYSDTQEWNNSNHCYPKKVVNLCTTKPNVYADLSYLHSLLDNGDDKMNFISNLKAALNKPGSPKFIDRIIFGSDWHMCHLIGKTNDYLNVFKEIFNDNFDEYYLRKFLFQNALQFLSFSEYVEKEKNKTPAFFRKEALKHLELVIKEGEN